MKKLIIHFTQFDSGYQTAYTACGVFSIYLKTTVHRDKVTCKNCKATKRFRKEK